MMEERWPACLLEEKGMAQEWENGYALHLNTENQFFATCPFKTLQARSSLR